MSTPATLAASCPMWTVGAERPQRGRGGRLRARRCRRPARRGPAGSGRCPLIPAPPMPTKCTRPSSAGPPSALIGAGPVAPAAAPPEDQLPGQRDVGVPVAERGGRLGHRRQPARVRQQRRQRPRGPLRGAVGVGDHDPAAGRDHRLGQQALLAVAVRQRHVRRRAGRPRSARRRCSPRTGTAPDPRRRRPAPSGPGRAPARTAGRPPATVGAGTSLRGPAACSTWMPAAASAPAAPIAAVLSVRAPCEPPVTSRVGQVRAQAERGPRPRPGGRPGPASRSACRIGSPSVTVCVQAGDAVGRGGDAGRVPGAEPVGQPGRGLASCTTIGMPRRRRGQVRRAPRRSRRTRRPTSAPTFSSTAPAPARPAQLGRQRQPLELGLRGTRTRAPAPSG